MWLTFSFLFSPPSSLSPATSLSVEGGCIASKNKCPMSFPVPTRSNVKDFDRARKKEKRKFFYCPLVLCFLHICGSGRLSLYVVFVIKYRFIFIFCSERYEINARLTAGIPNQCALLQFVLNWIDTNAQCWLLKSKVLRLHFISWKWNKTLFFMLLTPNISSRGSNTASTMDMLILRVGSHEQVVFFLKQDYHKLKNSLTHLTLNTRMIYECPLLSEPFAKKNHQTWFIVPRISILDLWTVKSKVKDTYTRHIF